MASTTAPLQLLGAPGSPYTRKMLALLRYRRIPYAMRWGGHQNPPPGLPVPKVRLLPTFYFPTPDGAVEAVVDSTPIIRRLERSYAGRSVLPTDPVLAFLDYLIEDYADEWLTKAMFHYRWHHKADRDNAGPILVHWSNPRLSREAGERAAAAITKRQFERLYVVGSNDTTAPIIEASYHRFLELLDAQVERAGYLLGSRPSAADFAVFGQLTQLGIIEPTPAAILARWPRLRSWLDRVDDLSGLEPTDQDWSSRADAAANLRPLLCEIGRVYAPFLLANAAAAAAGDTEVRTTIDAQPWVQPTFPYQAKCLEWLRAERAALPAAERSEIDALLLGTGCEQLFTA